MGFFTFVLIIIFAAIFLFLFKDIWNALLKVLMNFFNGEGSADDSMKKEVILQLEERIDILTRKIALDISPKNCDFAAWLSSSSVPLDEAKEDAQTLLYVIAKMKQLDDSVRIPLELSEGIAYIALKDYKNGIKLIKHYLSNMDRAWKKARIMRDEGQFLSFKSIGDAEYYRTHYSEALKWYQKALTIKDENTDVLVCAGLCALRAGKYNEAQDFFEKALEKEGIAGNKESVDYSTYLKNIGAAMQARGNFNGALDSFKKALAIERRVFGLEHEKVAVSYNNIGLVLKALGNVDEALEKFKKALSIDQNVLGDEHPNVAIDYNNIGGALHALEDYPGALENLRKALEIEKKAFSKEHPRIAPDLKDPAGKLQDQSDYASALGDYKKTLEMDKKAFGEDHPHVAFRYDNIGLSLQEHGDYTGALENFRKALEIYKKILGEENLYVSTEYSNIAGLYYSMGKPEEGLPYIKDAYRIYRRFLGPDHPDSRNARQAVVLHGGKPEEIDKQFQMI